MWGCYSQCHIGNPHQRQNLKFRLSEYKIWILFQMCHFDFYIDTFHPCHKISTSFFNTVNTSRFEKVGLKLNIQETKILASGPITSWQIDGETVERVTDFIFWAPKSLQMVIAAMKLKDVYSLERKLWPT